MEKKQGIYAGRIIEIIATEYGYKHVKHLIRDPDTQKTTWVDSRFVEPLIEGYNDHE